MFTGDVIGKLFEVHESTISQTTAIIGSPEHTGPVDGPTKNDGGGHVGKEFDYDKLKPQGQGSLTMAHRAHCHHEQGILDDSGEEKEHSEEADEGDEGFATGCAHALQELVTKEGTHCVHVRGGVLGTQRDVVRLVWRCCETSKAFTMMEISLKLYAYEGILRIIVRR